MFSSIKNIEDYLQELVPKTTQLQFTGEKGILRTREFLKLLGSPQNTLKVIHVAGTSGKGSTSFMISHLLASQGFAVGLHLSPHLLDIRERTEINNTLIEEKKYVRYFEEVYPAIEKMKNSAFGAITYFEALIGFTFYVFAQEKVNYAVVETGLGGEFDGTNVVDRADKLSVITKIGFDHMNVLGTTLQKIAHQKAMICANGGELITIQQSPSAYHEIKKVVQQKNAHLFSVEKNSVKNVRLSQKNTNFSFNWEGIVFKNITLGLLGDHQVQNASLALATLCHLSKRDGFTLKLDAITPTLKNLRFKGRFDILSHKNNQIILDGAHNVQKMRALLKTIKKLFPDEKFTFVLAFKKGKEYKKMIQMIIPYAEKIIITHIFSDSQDLQHLSVLPEMILEEIKKLGFSNVEVKKNIEDIVKTIQTNNSSSVVSGSLYLLGDVYKAL